MHGEDRSFKKYQKRSVGYAGYYCVTLPNIKEFLDPSLTIPVIISNLKVNANISILDAWSTPLTEVSQSIF